MKRILFVTFLLLASAAPSMAGDHAEQQTLGSAHRPIDLFQGNGDPFDLELDFTAQFKGAMQGHLSLRWKSQDQWWSKVEVGGFEQITIKNGEMEYTSRNFGYTPRQVLNLFSLLHFRDIHQEFIAQKEKERKENGLSLMCVQAERKDFQMDKHEMCLDMASHDLLSDEWHVSEHTSRAQFADYTDFNGVRFPRKLELVEDGNNAISASVASLEPSAFDSALLTPPQGAIERRKCPGIKPAVLNKELSPNFPVGGEDGTISVSFTVLPNGLAQDFQITQSLGNTADQDIVSFLKKARFKPAMCGDEPVVSDSAVTINYHHRN